MGANIKNLRIRIKSVDSTLHLTNAMGLVASSKIRKATEKMMKAREYSAAHEESINLLLACRESEKSPFVKKHEGNRTKIIVIAGDRGLAGGYNSNVFKLAAQYPDAEIRTIGKKAAERFDTAPISVEKFTYADCIGLTRDLCRGYAENEFDKLFVIHTNYISVMSQEAVITQLLPLNTENKKASTGIIFEPDELTVLNALIPEYVAGKLYAFVRESNACEQVARRNAMDSASKNAEDMLDSLYLEYNRARQGAITQEITEIVAAY